jgi:protein-disulfide isomerase-like protein with CxxC motif
VPVHVLYVTDPACPWSWGAEPALRRIQALFGDALRITYVMGGLARQFGRPLETARHWLDAAAATGMPADPRLWWDAPLASSYPASLAVKAAAEQGLDGPYLRRVREGIALEGRKLDHAEALTAMARGVPGLSVDRFANDLQSNAVVEAFGADLDRARTLAPAHHNSAGRIPFPSFLLESGEGVFDSTDPAALERLVAGAGVGSPAPAPTVEEALRRFGRMATAEVAAVCDLPGPRAPAELWRLALEWRTRREHELWVAA